MKIGINGQVLLVEHEKPTGVYVYTYNLVNSLAKIDTSNDYIVYLSGQHAHVDSYETLVNNNPRFKKKIVNKFLLWTQESLARELFTDKVDVYFSAVHTLPIIRSRSSKYVVMIHGLEYAFSPLSNTWKRFTQKLPVWWAAYSADKIIVPSIATKEAIIKQLPFVSESKINVVPEGVSLEYKIKEKTEIQDTLQKFKLQNAHYLVFISTIQPRKNLPRTIEAFAKIIKNNPSVKDTKLVVIGKKGWNYEESLKAPEAFGVLDNVVFTGALPLHDVINLLNGASGYINFSLEEGFGLTALEAMSCGLACGLSDIPSHKEVAGECAFYANPKSVESMQACLEKLIHLPSDQRAEISKAAVSRAHLFTWERTAIQTLNVFTDLVK